MTFMRRWDYVRSFGPTIGDRIRPADTNLLVEVERDFTLYGEEVKFGGGKAIRDGMAQSQLSAEEGACDTVITNTLIIDHWGIVKADIGLRAGRICGIGKAGNPDTQPAVDVIIGPCTEIIAGEGKIVTAGGVDTHIHFICPQQIDEALAAGMTTLLGGGTGPATGTAATTLHARPLEHSPHVAGSREFARECRVRRKGKCVAAFSFGGNGAGRGVRAQTA